MCLNDELSWMNLVRRVRFYLPSGQFYDSDFDCTMGMKEIQKIIGLIASIKEPFSLYYEGKELPNTNEQTLNTLFKDKPYNDIIITHIQIHSKILYQNNDKKQNSTTNKNYKKYTDENKCKYKTNIKKDNNQVNINKDYKNKEGNLIFLFKNYTKKVEKMCDFNNNKEQNNYIKNESTPEINMRKVNPDININYDQNKEKFLKDLSLKIKISGMAKNT